MALIVWILTVAIAWLAVRPVVGIIALIAVAGIIWLLIYMKKKNPKPESPKSDELTHESKKDSSEPEIIEA